MTTPLIPLVRFTNGCPVSFNLDGTQPAQQKLKKLVRVIDQAAWSVDWILRVLRNPPESLVNHWTHDLPQSPATLFGIHFHPITEGRLVLNCEERGNDGVRQPAPKDCRRSNISVVRASIDGASAVGGDASVMSASSLIKSR